METWRATSTYFCNFLAFEILTPFGDGNFCLVISVTLFISFEILTPFGDGNNFSNYRRNFDKILLKYLPLSGMETITLSLPAWPFRMSFEILTPFGDGNKIHHFQYRRLTDRPFEILTPFGDGNDLRSPLYQHRAVMAFEILTPFGDGNSFIIVTMDSALSVSFWNTYPFRGWKR